MVPVSVGPLEPLPRPCPDCTGKQPPAEPQGDVAEKLARNQWHRMHRAGLVSVPWDEATGWDRDKAIEGATFDLAAITPLLALEVKERLEKAAKELTDAAQTPEERALVSVASSLVIAALDTPAPSEPEEG
jgi:hypothetical protein